MAIFKDFLKTLSSDSQKKGKQFEYFVKWFLKKDPKWSTLVDDVWLWSEYPERWGADCGVDLVFKDTRGEFWAVQAKCYSEEHSVTKHDIDKFLSESNRSSIKNRLLITTTNKIAANATKVCNAQEKPVIRFMLSHFEDANIEYPSSFGNLLKTKCKPKPSPYKYQLEAISAACQEFKSTDKGQLIMACGTGKTFITLWIKEQLSAQTTLVLLPSLGLLSQSLNEWTYAAQFPFSTLCVCSDQTVSIRRDDEFIHYVGDLAFPVSSSVDEIKSFLKTKGNKVIFSTYQSSKLIERAQQDSNIPFFDLVIADEAHRCAGAMCSDFSIVLNEKRIRSKKRLFATATPRMTPGRDPGKKGS